MHRYVHICAKSLKTLIIAGARAQAGGAGVATNAAAIRSGGSGGVDSRTSEEKEIEREMDQEIERQIQVDEMERQMKVHEFERQLRENKTPDTSDH